MDSTRKSGSFASGVENTFGRDKPDFAPKNPDKDARKAAEETSTGDYRGSDNSRKTNVGVTNDSAASALNAAETAAVNNDPENRDVREGESNPANPGENLYSGSGRSAPAMTPQAKIKLAVKKHGPLGLIVVVFLIVGGFMLGGQSLMPFSLVAQIQETYDSIKDSNVRRSKTIWHKQLKNAGITDPVHKKIFGGNYFKVTNKQKNKLKQQGIFVVEDFGGSGKTAILHNDGSGSLKIVAADAADIDVLKNAAGNVDLSKIDADIDLSKMHIDTSTAGTFDTMFNSDTNFRNSYKTGAMTWRGSVGAWFDKTTKKYLEVAGIKRNRHLNFRERVKQETEAGGDVREAQKKVVRESMQSTSEAEISDTRHSVEEEENDKGETTEKLSTSTEQNSGSRGMDPKAAVEKVKGIVNGKLKGGGGASALVNGVCGVFDVVAAVNLLVMGQELAQGLALASMYFEAFDKVKAGDGNDSPIHILAENLTKAAPSYYTEYDAGNDTAVERVIPGKENTSAMQAESIKSLYSGKPVDTSDASVKALTFSADRYRELTPIGGEFAAIVGGTGGSIETVRNCTIARMAASLVNVALNSALKLVSVIIDLATGVAMQAVVSGLIGLVVPYAVSVLVRDFTNLDGGENEGNLIGSSANPYMGTNHLRGGGSLADAETYVAYAAAHEEVIAEQARYDRETLSPFDVSSPYTFAGSLLKQVATVYTIKSPFSDGLGTVGTMLSNSIMAMLPGATAYSIAQNLPNMDEYSEQCPYLASIGAVGDAFCNPYIITDVETIEIDPTELMDHIMVDSKGRQNIFTDNNSVSINPDSNLGEYIANCSWRTSPFGVQDQNIADRYTTTKGNGVVSFILGLIPILGDIVDLLDNWGIFDNLGWVSGESCVAKKGSDSDWLGGKASNWSENKYYQRFVEDQRYFESLDDEYTSPVTTFTETLAANLTEDDSYEAMLARNSGLSKDTVVALLDLMDYYTIVANYDPSTRYEFAAPEPAEPVVIESSSVVAKAAEHQADLANIAGYIVYADLRTRNYAV